MIIRVIPKVFFPKSCKKCKYFDKDLCLAFSSQEPISGNVILFEADDVRRNELLCGPDGSWYVPKKVFKNNEGYIDK